MKEGGRISQKIIDAVLLGLFNLLFVLIIISGFPGATPSLTKNEIYQLARVNSLLSDFDLDITNDLSSEKFQESIITENSESLQTLSANKNGNSWNGLALSFYLIPGWLIGILINDVVFISRLFMSLLYVALMVMLYLFCRDLKISRKSAVLAWLFASFTIPFASSSISISTEICAALLTLIATWALLAWDEKSVLNPLFCGLCLSLLPWLDTMYVILVIIFGVGFIAYILRGKAPILRSLLVLAVAPVLMIATLSGITLMSGDSANTLTLPSQLENANESVEIDSEELAIEGPAARLFRKSLLPFFDQRFGLFFYSPIYLLAIAGLIFMFGRVKMARTFTAVFVTFILMFAFGQLVTGSHPPAFFLIPVLWVLVPALAFSFDQLSNWLTALYALFSASVACCFSMIFIFQSHLIYHSLIPDSDVSGNKFLTSIFAPFDLSQLFPDLVNPKDLHAIPLLLFLTISLALVLFFIRLAKSQSSKTTDYGLMILSSGFPVLLMLIGTFFAEFAPEREILGEGSVKILPRAGAEIQFELISFEGDLIPGIRKISEGTSQALILCENRPELIVIKLYSSKKQDIVLEVEGIQYQASFNSAGWKEITIPGDRSTRWRRWTAFRLKTNKIILNNNQGADSVKTDDSYLIAFIKKAELNEQNSSHQ